MQLGQLFLQSSKVVISLCNDKLLSQGRLTKEAVAAVRVACGSGVCWIRTWQGFIACLIGCFSAMIHLQLALRYYLLLAQKGAPFVNNSARFLSNFPQNNSCQSNSNLNQQGKTCIPVYSGCQWELRSVVHCWRHLVLCRIRIFGLVQQRWCENWVF